MLVVDLLLQHCLVPDEQFLPMQDGGGGMVAAHQKQVEASATASASASCSYVPSDDTGTYVLTKREKKRKKTKVTQTRTDEPIESNNKIMQSVDKA